MRTQQTFTAASTGYVFADITSHTGSVAVTVDPSITRAEFTVSTPDSDGPAADAVRRATFHETGRPGQRQATVKVPRIEGGIVSSGGIINTGRMGSVQVAGTVTSGMSMIGGDIYIGGRKVVSNGQVVAQHGDVISADTGHIDVEVRLPQHSGLRVESDSARIQVRGEIESLDTHTVSGSVTADAVHTLYGHSVSGSIQAGRVTARATLNNTSGSLRIDAYDGGELRMNNVSGSVDVTATPASRGEITATSVSGNITLRGAAHLRQRTSTVSGRVTSR